MRAVPHNLAGAAAGWSASNRSRVILGWLAAVVLIYLAGSLIGQRHLTDVQMANGDSSRAMQIYERSFRFHSGEQVLVQGRGALASAARCSRPTSAIWSPTSDRCPPSMTSVRQ
jgi:hypothetical protein